MAAVDRALERLRVEVTLNTGEELYLEVDSEQTDLCGEMIKNTGLAMHPKAGGKHWQFVKPGEIASISATPVWVWLGRGVG